MRRDAPRHDTQRLRLLYVSGAAAGLVSGILLAAVFDLVAPRLGGLKLDVAIEAAPDPGTRKVCPKCSAKLRADRSFCPECDYSLDAPA